jgi:hypothetical protein
MEATHEKDRYCTLGWRWRSVRSITMAPMISNDPAPMPSGGKGLVIIARDIDLAELTAFSMAYAAGVRPDLRNSSKRAA